MLDVLDPRTDRGRVYRALILHGRCRPDQLAHQVDRPPEAVALALAELAADDVVIKVDDLWEAQSPGLVTAELLREEEARRERLWAAGAELDRIYHVARRDVRGAHDLQTVADPQALIALTTQLQERATDEIRWLDRPPYRSRPADFEAQEEVQSRRMAAGLRYRTLYHQAVYDDQALFGSMTRMVALGEDARVLSDLPVKLTIGDDHTALLVPDPDSAGALVVHAPALLTALIGVFETLWTFGVPLTSGEASLSLSEEDRTIISLMAAGVTDDSIGRRLDLSRRTVVRRITALMHRLGATTRFQAGVQAAHRGWL